MQFGHKVIAKPLYVRDEIQPRLVIDGHPFAGGGLPKHARQKVDQLRHLKIGSGGHVKNFAPPSWPI
jgi:hypothetical protein